MQRVKGLKYRIEMGTTGDSLGPEGTPRCTTGEKAREGGQEQYAVPLGLQI